MTNFRPRGPMLHPRVAVLRRPSGRVQLGWDPEHAVVLDPPGIEAEAVLRFVRLLDGLRSHPQIVWQAGRFGIGAADALRLLGDIETTGLLVHPRPRPEVTAIHVHGRGPLSDSLAAGIRRMGLRPTRSRDYDANRPIGDRAADVVLLADALVPDPQLVNDLVLHRIPHLQIRIRDGRGVVGPLVLPGATSCLRCADLTRGDLDADWPHLAAQLLDRVGHATPATVTATVALALRDLEAILSGVADHPPQTLDTTLELDPDSHRIDRRNWPAHPGCGCRALRERVPR